MSIGDKLRAIDEQAGHNDEIPANRPENKEKAEGSREKMRNTAGERTGGPRRGRSEADEERRSER